jgi:S1-C subfamily serine protease
MKLRISPTSPKNNIEQESQINSLYKEHFQAIQKPQTRKNSAPLWFLLLVVVIGFASGIIGLLALIAYGSDIAILNKLPFFSNGLPQTIITTGRSAGGIATSDIQKTVDSLSASIVSIYETQSGDGGLAAVYTGDHLRGNGFILTEDGYIVTTQEIVSGQNDLTVITKAGDLYQVESTSVDPATQLAFLKIKASGLSSVGISTSGEIKALSEVIILKQLIYKGSPVTGIGTVAATGYSMDVVDKLTAVSSENTHRTLLLSENFSSVLNNGIVFTPNGEVLGMLVQKGGNYLIVPFADVTDIISQVVGGQKIIRPYLGVYYINMAMAPGLPESLSQSLSQGALIYSDDEDNRPSVMTGSPAQTAHLKKGDVIVAIDNQVIDAQHTLESIILQHKPQDSVIAKVMRNKTEMSLTIVIGEYKN